MTETWEIFEQSQQIFINPFYNTVLDIILYEIEFWFKRKV